MKIEVPLEFRIPRDMNQHLTAIFLGLCVFVIAAGPVALDNKPTKVVVWTGLVAAAFYWKGKYEDKPGPTPPVQVIPPPGQVMPVHEVAG